MPPEAGAFGPPSYYRCLLFSKQENRSQYPGAWFVKNTNAPGDMGYENIAVITSDRYALRAPAICPAHSHSTRAPPESGACSA